MQLPHWQQTAFIATPASAAISIGISTNGGATINTVATDSVIAGTANYLANAGGYFYNVSGNGFPLLPMPALATNSVNIRNEGGAAGTIDVYITQTGLSAFTGGLLSTFTSNTILGATATLTSYYSLANALYGGTQLQTATFANPGVFSGANAVSGTFSETVRYTLNFTGGTGSNFNGTANLSAVPEPATWAMMLVGFGAMGAAMRRRRSAATLAQVA